MVPEAVQKDVIYEKQALISGEDHVFSGPIKDQEGTLRIPEGESMSDQEIWGMDWFVQGVIGTAE